MKSFWPRLVCLLALISACQNTPHDAAFRPGARWHVRRFRASSEPATFPRLTYPLLDALRKNQTEWVVTNPGYLVLRNAQGNQTTVRFTQQGDTLTLVFKAGESLRILIQTQDAKRVELRTLDIPQVTLSLSL
jgi:hypothetical protein